MALNIKDPATDALARRVSALTGQSITQAVHSSLEARLAELIRENAVDARRDFMMDVAHRARLARNAAPDADTLPTADEMLGYLDAGLPT